MQLQARASLVNCQESLLSFSRTAVSHTVSICLVSGAGNTRVHITTSLGPELSPVHTLSVASQIACLPVVCAKCRWTEKAPVGRFVRHETYYWQCSKCLLNHCLEWYKWVLTNFDHDRQWFNTLIPPLHETAAVTVDCISRKSRPVRLVLGYTTVDIHFRDRRYEWDSGMMYFTG